MSSLPAGLFDHLDALTTLWLQGNQLSSLPTGLFDHLDALTTLWLPGNQLTGLPEGLFDGLTALEELFLNGNQLSTLPEGLFDGLTTLTQLRLYGNSVDPLLLTVSLEKVGTDQVKAIAPTGAPFEIVLPLTVTNGSISGATSITIPAGSLESLPITVTRTPSTTAAVTMDMGTLPGLPANHSGYALGKSTDLPLEIIGATTPNTAAVNIPDANLRAKIETALGKISGDPISAAEMATLTALSAQDASISDLTGLETATNLTELQLWDNNIADIAAVAGLTNLTKLYLWGNAITDLSHVAGLTNLTDLRLGENSIANASHVAGLTNLTHLDLRENSVSDMAAVAGLTNLTELRIGDNTISSIAAVASLTKLEWLDAPNNSISDMAVVANLTNLTSLDLSGNSISDLSAVAGLTKLLELYLAENAVSDLSPLVANTGLGADNEIDVQGNLLDYPSIYTHIPALQARSVFIDFDNRTPTTLVKVSGDSQQGTSGTALAQPFVVEVQDGESAAFTGVPVTFAITAGGGTLSATSTTTDANGQAESTLTLGNSAGTNTVRASAQGIAQSETFTAEAITTDTAVGEGTEVTTYNVGDTIPLPSGFQTARLTIGSGRAVTADNGTYTCVAAVDCIIANGAVTQGTIEVTTSAVASNNAPEFTDGVSTTLSVAENTVAGVNLGAAIAATDADNEVLTYTLGGTDAAAFAIERATGQLQTSAALDYETTSSYSVVVTVSDGSLTDTINVTINVTDIDESLIPVCDRTPQVRDAIVAVVPGVSTCGEVTKAHLTSDITSLFLNGQGITTLQAGDFEDLTSLTELRLYDNQLTTLPADLFDGLGALTTLYLNGNQLTTLPDGLFGGLSSLTTLYLYGNSVDPLSLTVSLEKVGADQVKAVAPSGAPFDIVLPLTVANGDISGGATTITIPAGGVESQLLTVTRTPGTTAAVTVDIGTLPGLPANHSGYALVKSTDLPLEVIGEVAVPVTIPDANLRAKIESALGKTSGDPISAAEMATLTALSAQDAAISDLTGLETATNLTELQLWDNNIAAIAAVAGLTKLTKLYLWGNTITDIAAVAALTNLTDLRLGENSIANVSAVAALTNLTHLGLRENSISDIAAVAALTNLTELRIGDNSISSIAAVANLTNLVWLDAPNNSISDIAAVTNLTSLTSLDLSGNSIADLSAVTGLTNLLELILAENAVSDLSPLVANTGLGADTEIDVQGNPLDYPSIYTHIPALQARSVYIDFDNRTPTTLVKISGDSQQGTPSTALAQPFVVEVQDGESAAFAGVPVAFAVTAGGGTLSATSTATDANGRAQSTLTLGNSAGTNTVGASAQGISQTATFTAEATTTNTAVDESTAVTLELSPTEVAEDAGATTITVTGTLNGAALTTATDVRLTISGTATRDADYSVTVLPLTIPAGSVSGTATLTLSLVDDSVDEDDETVIFTATTTSGLTLSPSSLTVTITDNDTVVSAETTVCDRTPQVRDAIVAAVPSVSDCNDVTEAHLAAITSLNLADKSISSLKVGDFDGLSSLTELYLTDNQLTSLPEGVFNGLTALTGLSLWANQLTSLPEGVFSGLTALATLGLTENQLTSLPEGVFSGLTALTTLGLTENQLTSLPEGVFSGLTALTWLELHANQLTSLPEGVFSGLTALTRLRLEGNAVNQLPLTVSLEKVGTTQFKATVHTGAPFTIILPLSVANGTIDGGATTITIPIGSVESESLTVSRTSGTTAAVTVDIGTLPGLPTAQDNAGRFHQGYALVKSSDLPLKIFSDLAGGICDRTPQVRNAIVAAVSDVSTCAEVTETHLATGVTSLFLNGQSITALQAGDFEGLTSLMELRLYDNQLSTLPADLFDDLSALTTLYLNGNQLTTLPDGLFDGLSALTTLYLYGNSVDPLPLTVSLEKVGADQVKAVAPVGAPFEIVLPLTFANGSLSGGATTITIPAGSIESQPLTVVRTPGTSAAVTVDIGTLPGLPANHSGYALVKSTDLPLEVIGEVAVTLTIPDANLRAKIETALGKTSGDPISAAEMATLTALSAQDAAISDLTGLETATNLTELQLWDNNIADIAAVAGLTNLTKLYLWGNAITDISHVAALTKLTDLRLGENSIANVSAVAALTKLTHLGLRENSVSDIAAVAGLTNLTELRIGDNTISSIAAVANLTKLVWLDAPNNSISDIAAVANLTNLTSLDLSGNSISDLSAVAGLTNLLELVLAENAISDLSPLVSNTGLGENTEIDVQGNPLSYPSIYTHIPVLQARSIFIDFDNRTPTTLVKISGDSQQGAPSTALAQPFVVEVQDANSVAFAGVPVAFAVTAGGGTLSATSTTTDANGQAVSTLTLGTSAGTNTVQVSVQGIAQSATFTSEATTTNTAPVFTDGESTTRTVAENTAAGVNIGMAIAATDANNDALTYTLGGTDAAAFAIESTTGQLQTKAALDYETKTSYTVSVSVSVSDGSLTDAITVTITVTDLDDTPPVSAETTVCDRTPQVRDAIVGILQLQTPSPSTCGEVTQAQLSSGVTSLFLNDQSITALQAGDFAGLTSLAELRLYDNQLSTLPADLFDGLSALTTLYLNGNQLSTLPDGLFNGLSSLTTLYLYGNSVDPLPLTVSLEKVGADQVKAVAPSGAPFEMVLPLTVANGSISGGATTITIPAGSFESQPLTVTRSPGTAAAVTVDMGTLPGLPANHSGYALGKSADLPLEMFSLLTGGICDRTAQVQTAIVAAVPSVSTCDEVTQAQLAVITSLNVTDKSIGSLKVGDFDGLSALTTLNLTRNQLSSLPAGIFDKLNALKELHLGRNQLSSLPAGIFDKLNALTTLNLSGNQLSSLPAGIFDKLNALTRLYLAANQLSSLPAGIFDNLNTLTGLDLGSNSVNPLPLTVSLEKVGEGQFKATAPAGAPFDIALPLTVVDGTITGGANSIAIRTGRVESDVFTVTRTPGTTSTVTVAIGILPGLPANHIGYALVKSADLPLAVISSPANTAPVFTDGTSTSRTIAENTENGVLIGTAIAATDADNDVLTYTLGGTDAASFDIERATGQLKTHRHGHSRHGR